MSSARLKIALCANTSWSIYNFRRGLVRMLIKRGVTVHVIAPRDAFTAKLIAEGVIYIPLHLKSYSAHPWDDIRLTYELFKLYRKERYDKVFHYTAKPNIYGSIAARMAAIPGIAVYTGLGRIFQMTGVRRPIIRGLLSLSARAACELWFLNEENRLRFCQSIGPGSLMTKTKILPSEGIDTQRFRSRRRSDQGVSYRILYAGRMLTDKGVVEYVEAAKALRPKYPRWKFELLGMIDYTNDQALSLETIMSWHKSGYIRYLGSTEDVRPYLDRSEFVVFPSYYEEGISRILMEAASMELPIITTEHVGCQDVVLDRVTGFLCTPRSVDDLVDKIEQIITLTPEERREMGCLGREYVKSQFDESVVINHYLKCLDLSIIETSNELNLK